VSEGGQKNERGRRDILIHELRSLRKGAGLTLRRLSQASMLRDVIAERLNKPPNEITLNLMHLVLLEELDKLGESIEARATRNALGVRPKGDPGNITTRRADFAAKYDRHPDTVEAYENHGIEEISNRLLASSIQPKNMNTSHNDSTADPQQPEEVRLAAQDMVTTGLQRLYSIPSHVKDTIKAFGRATPPFVDVNIEWLLLSALAGKIGTPANLGTISAAKNLIISLVW